MVGLPVIQRLYNLHVLWSDLAAADMSSRKADLSSLTGEGRSLRSVNYLKEPCRQLTSYSGLHRSIVIIYVRPEQYPFHLHRERLCQQSLDKYKLCEECFYSCGRTATSPSGSHCRVCQGLSQNHAITACHLRVLCPLHFLNTHGCGLETPRVQRNPWAGRPFHGEERAFGRVARLRILVYPS